jgi:hypothetical protein
VSKDSQRFQLKIGSQSLSVRSDTKDRLAGEAIQFAQELLNEVGEHRRGLSSEQILVIALLELAERHLSAKEHVIQYQSEIKHWVSVLESERDALSLRRSS